MIRQAITNALRDPLNKGWAMRCLRSAVLACFARSRQAVSALRGPATIAGALRDWRGLLWTAAAFALAFLAYGVTP